MDNPRKILVIQLKRAGDVIVTTPIPSLLRARFPEVRIDFLVQKSFAPLLEHHPAIDQIQIYDLKNVRKTWQTIRRESYDWVIDFQGSPRSAMLCLFSGARKTAGYRVPFWGFVYDVRVRRPGGAQAVTEGKRTLLEALASNWAATPTCQLVLAPEEKAWARQAMPTSKPVVGLAPATRRPLRQWPGASYVALAQRYLKEGHEVWWFWGGPQEEAEVGALARQAPGSKMIPDTSLRQMAALLQQCCLAVTNDNGPKHLAAAVGIPSVTIYGPTDPACWAPQGVPHRVVTAPGIGCIGCNLNECPFEHECMTQVSPEQVYRAGQQIIQQESVR